MRRTTLALFAALALTACRRPAGPPQQPVLGRYDSTDPTTAEQHIAWCSQYGIDFLTLDWWPNRPSQAPPSCASPPAT